MHIFCLLYHILFCYIRVELGIDELIRNINNKKYNLFYNVCVSAIGAYIVFIISYTVLLYQGVELGIDEQIRNINSGHI